MSRFRKYWHIWAQHLFLGLCQKSYNFFKIWFLHRLSNFKNIPKKTILIIYKKIVIFNNNKNVFWLELLIYFQTRLLKSGIWYWNSIATWIREMYENVKPCIVLILENKYKIKFVDLVIFNKWSKYFFVGICTCHMKSSKSIYLNIWYMHI